MVPMHRQGGSTTPITMPSAWYYNNSIIRDNFESIVTGEDYSKNGSLLAVESIFVWGFTLLF